MTLKTEYTSELLDATVHVQLDFRTAGVDACAAWSLI